MALLRGIEQRLESLFEGIFGRAFRSNVQPIELARKLRKEMDDHRSVSVSRVYVPNEYTVYLSPRDREQFAGYEPSLIDELRNHLADHAKREGYALVSPPTVLLETDDDLSVGEFGIAVRMAQPGRGRSSADAPAPEADFEPGHTMIYKPKSQPTQTASPVELGVAREVVSLSWDGEHREIRRRRTVIGRSKDCDVQLADPNVSRRHAELRQEGTAYWVVDLDSTNGLEVNGKQLKRTKLNDGDTVTIGSTEITFRRETS